MLVKRRGGMTEYIPSPREKREALVRDHFTEVVELIHKRLARIEQEFGLPEDEAQACASLLTRIREEEQRTIACYASEHLPPRDLTDCRPDEQSRPISLDREMVVPASVASAQWRD